MLYYTLFFSDKILIWIIKIKIINIGMKDEEYVQEEVQQQQTTMKIQQNSLHRQKLKSKQGVFSALIIASIIMGLCMIIYLLLEVANYVQPAPKVFKSSNQFNFRASSLKDTKLNHKIEISSSQIQSMYNNVEIQESSPLNLITLQQKNKAHMLYRKAIHQLDYFNLNSMMQHLSQQLLTQQSQITYGQYLRAIKYLSFTDFSLIEQSKYQKILRDQQKNIYQSKYGILESKKQMQICLLLILSRKGMQSSDYFYAIKSIFQQQYRNFKAIIINNVPQMNMDTEIVNLVKEMSKGRAIIVSKKSQTQKISEGRSVHFFLHKYCSQSQITVIMRDNGQLIGKQVFSILNKLHIKKQAPLIFTNYLLQMSNSLGKLQDDYRYKVEIYPKLKQQLSIRNQPYKTKYLKSYRTSLLLSVPIDVFTLNQKTSEGMLFQASLQFAAIQLACGKYFFLQQILYKVSKSGLQTVQQIEYARKYNKIQCKNQKNTNNKQFLDIDQSP